MSSDHSCYVIFTGWDLQALLSLWIIHANFITRSLAAHPLSLGSLEFFSCPGDYAYLSVSETLISTAWSTSVQIIQYASLSATPPLPPQVHDFPLIVPAGGWGGGWHSDSVQWPALARALSLYCRLTSKLTILSGHLHYSTSRTPLPGRLQLFPTHNLLL